MSNPNTGFKPSLGLFDATMIVAGSMIGSGIFIVSADITRNVGGAGWLIVVWAVTGFMTLTAALSYGEAKAVFLRTVFLHRLRVLNRKLPRNNPYFDGSAGSPYDRLFFRHR